MKRIFFWIILGVAVLGAISAIRLVLDLQKPLPKAQLLSEPAKAPYPTNIGGRGLVESVDENVRIAPAVPALVVEVPVHVGDEVKQGDVLVRQDSREAEANILMQQADVAALRTQLHETDVALADKRDQWARVERLIASKVASEDEKQRTQFAKQTAEAQLGSMKARIASAEAMLAKTKVVRDLLTVRAPRDGRILQVNTRAGEFASPAEKDPILLLGQVDTLQLRADVDEDNASRVRPEMAARAYLKGRHDVEVALKFIRIEPYILPKKSLTGESSERVDTRVLQIIYRFDRPRGVGIYVGQQMDVFIDGDSTTAK